MQSIDMATYNVFIRVRVHPWGLREEDPKFNENVAAKFTQISIIHHNNISLLAMTGNIMIILK